MKITQKGIYWANLNPVQGSEQSGRRPVVVISGEAMNQNIPICIVCPISSHVKKYPASIFLKSNKDNNLEQDSEILAFQVRTISSKRLKTKIGEITEKQLESVVSELNELF